MKNHEAAITYHPRIHGRQPAMSIALRPNLSKATPVNTAPIKAPILSIPCIIRKESIINKDINQNQAVSMH